MIAPLAGGPGFMAMNDDAPPARGAVTGQSGAGAGWKADDQRSVATLETYALADADATVRSARPCPLVDFAVAQIAALAAYQLSPLEAELLRSERDSFAGLLLINGIIDTVLRSGTLPAGALVPLTATQRALVAAAVVHPDGDAAFGFLLRPGMRAMYQQRLRRFLFRRHLARP